MQLQRLWIRLGIYCFNNPTIYTTFISVHWLLHTNPHEQKPDSIHRRANSINTATWKRHSLSHPVLTNISVHKPVGQFLSDKSWLQNEPFWTRTGGKYLAAALLSSLDNALMHPLHLKNLLHFFLVLFLQETTILINHQLTVVSLLLNSNHSICVRNTFADWSLQIKICCDKSLGMLFVCRSMEYSVLDHDGNQRY